MSSTVGHHFSPADEEAERRRELRGDVASALARLAALRARVCGLGHVVPGDMSVLELQELLPRVTAALASAEESVSAAWREQRGFEAVTPGLSGQDDRTALHGAIADAEWLITGKGHLCDEEAVGAALVVFEDLAQSASVPGARALSLEIAEIIGRSLARYRAVMAVEDLRVRLLDLVRDAAAAEKEALRDCVSTVADLDAMAGYVLDSVRREDIARHRRAVASAVAEALEELGCVVGADFAWSLVTDGRATAGIGAHWLCLRLDLDGTALLVEGAHAEIVEELHAKLRERGVRLDDIPFVPDENWVVEIR